MGFRVRRRPGKTHLVIPDMQVKLGDLYDLPSLSTYDKRGSKASENRRLQRDIEAGDRALDILGKIWAKHGFAPRKHVTLGNHENRLERAINADPHLLDGAKRPRFSFAAHGWQEWEFLQPITIDGVRYCHFFPHNAKGKVTQTKSGAPNALAQVQRQMKSATAGHQQGLDIAVIPTPSGMQRGVIAGSFYLHDEEYMGPLNHYWRGLIRKHAVYCGDYSLCEVDMHWLAAKYRKFEPTGRKAA
jgi:hypothetical protein